MCHRKAVTRGMHKYGVSLPRFTHNDAEIIQASTKGERTCLPSLSHMCLGCV